jgi:hypothetical protein
MKLLALLGMLVLLSGLATFVYYVSLPYAGFEFAGRASIGAIDPGGPAASVGLQVGDRVLAMDGLPFRAGMPYLQPNQGMLQLTVLRDGQSIPLEITLTSPSLKERLHTTSHFLVALAFWIIAMSVLLLKPRKSESQTFVLVSLLSALALVVWLLADLGIPWASILMRTLVLVIGPFFVYFHAIFPERSDFRSRRILLASLCGTGLILWVLSVTLALIFGPGSEGLLSLTPVIELHFFICAVVSWVLLFRTYRATRSEASRRQVALVLLGTGMALLPFIVLIGTPTSLPRPTLFLPGYPCSCWLSSP